MSRDLLSACHIFCSERQLDSAGRRYRLNAVPIDRSRRKRGTFRHSRRTSVCGTRSCHINDDDDKRHPTCHQYGAVNDAVRRDRPTATGRPRARHCGTTATSELRASARDVKPDSTRRYRTFSAASGPRRETLRSSPVANMRFFWNRADHDGPRRHRRRLLWRSPEHAVAALEHTGDTAATVRGEPACPVRSRDTDVPLASETSGRQLADTRHCNSGSVRGQERNGFHNPSANTDVCAHGERRSLDS